MKSSEIRESFITFFESKAHKRVKSAPVLPIGDKSLLFTNAGMNQFKSIFLNTEQPKDLRVVNSQKCIRVSGKHNDLEEVGRDGFHHTFFEMLGNWSFGDYYKKEAIQWSWELFTEVWKLDKHKLWVTVFEEDDEAFEIWKEYTDIDSSRIIRSGAKDNFWEMAETGPCGPCSEIHYYVGDDPSNQDATMVNHSSEYWELWNLVFIQYNRLKDGSMEELPKKHVDTGAGLERLCSVLQQKNSNYQTDLFAEIISEIESISHTSYNDHEVSFNVLCDHIRMLTFSIADGVIPSNDGRGYVVRRVLRRASKFAMNLGVKEPILNQLVKAVVSVMSSHYPEIKEKQQYIEETILNEEESFLRTLEKGVLQFEKIISESKKTIIDGVDAFKLYDTYGFPLDLTQLMAEERQMTVDTDGFDVAMKKQRELAKSGQKFISDSIDFDWQLSFDKEHSIFEGYLNDQIESEIVNYALEDDHLILVLSHTPFYAESGGQIGDTGIIENSDFSAQVLDTQRNGEFILHYCQINSGAIAENLVVNSTIDSVRRKKIKNNHTATHLLHQAVKDTLGNHVNQAGSLVDPDYLRFDITHPNKISKNEIKQIEEIVNQKINDSINIETNIQSLDEAKKEGATALFGEKYGEMVRVVTIGSFSKELCGGTHVSNTSEIEKFKIKHEKAISSGVRRIHAISSSEVDLFMKDLEDSKKNQILVEQERQTQKELEKQLVESADIPQILSQEILINGIPTIISKVHLGNAGDLRVIDKRIRNNFSKGLIILFTKIDDKISLSVSLSTELINDSFNAGLLVKLIASLLGGGGGGKNDFAMAGGISINNSEVEIIQTIKDSIDKIMEKK